MWKIGYGNPSVLGRHSPLPRWTNCMEDRASAVAVAIVVDRHIPCEREYGDPGCAYSVVIDSGSFHKLPFLVSWFHLTSILRLQTNGEDM